MGFTFSAEKGFSPRKVDSNKCKKSIGYITGALKLNNFIEFFQIFAEVNRFIFEPILMLF